MKKASKKATPRWSYDELRERYFALENAARLVILLWEAGNLAEAVNDLKDALED
jgi:hypothetical protein